MTAALARVRTPEGLRWAAAAVLVTFALALPPLAGLVEIVSPDSISANFTVGVLGTSALVLALWAISYNLMLGYAGMVSFAHAAYYGIGAYTVALLYQDLHWSVLPGLALSPLVVGAAGLVTGFISLRAVRLYFSLLTLAISQVGYVIAFEWYSFTGGDNGIHGISPPDFLSNPTVLYYFVAAVVAVCLLIMFGLVRSPFGAALLAIRENRLRAASIGLNVKRYELAVFTISAAFAGVAGALFAIYDNQAFPDLMKWTESAHPIVVTLLGGSGTFLGPALGAAVYTWLANSVGKSLPAQFDIVLGAIVLGIVLVAPGGLGSALDGIRRVAARRRGSREPEEETSDQALGRIDVSKILAIRPVKSHAEHSSGATLLRVEGLSKRFGGLKAVDGVSLNVLEGRRHAVIGPNGAGKSTLFNLLTGQIRPDSGKVVFGGVDITGRRPHQLSRFGIGRAFQITNIFPKLTVLQNLQYSMLAHRGDTVRPIGIADRKYRDEAMQLLEAVGLGPSSRLQAGLLSHGDQRALELAISLALGTRLLLLDEPTAGMSPYETKRAMELVNGVVAQQGLTLLFCEHDMDIVFGIADVVTVMHQGRVLAEGTPEAIRANPEVQKIYLGDIDLDPPQTEAGAGA
ncbi:MAG TPA: branched-chain amino acid ABC transporter ATP-binding protein/permease [Candidatus Eisenbacteria bacterium]|nr:branched-chain amino acid ABC transporter ATP-binding protein/permease [Candidatus Eisenbacteria bacterium]